jgi:cyclohexyl-isocyanide hydratase
MRDTQVHLVAKTLAPCVSETGLAIVPTTTFADLPAVDLLFVPGGAGQIDAAEDAETLAWVAKVGEHARWVTSSCTGSLLLGCAGLLRGYRAATHWAFMDLLPLVGAIPTHRRVVTDRNRITSGGVTAGIDIALTIVAELAGRGEAERIQLALEYDPEPPFRSGHPNVAAPELVARVREAIAKRYEQRRDQLVRLTGSG